MTAPRGERKPIAHTNAPLSPPTFHTYSHPHTTFHMWATVTHLKTKVCILMYCMYIVQSERARHYEGYSFPKRWNVTENRQKQTLKSVEKIFVCVNFHGKLANSHPLAKLIAPLYMLRRIHGVESRHFSKYKMDDISTWVVNTCTLARKNSCYRIWYKN